MFATAEVTMFDKYIVNHKSYGFYGPNQEYGTRLMLPQRPKITPRKRTLIV